MAPLDRKCTRIAFYQYEYEICWGNTMVSMIGLETIAFSPCFLFIFTCEPFRSSSLDYISQKMSKMR